MRIVAFGELCLHVSLAPVRDASAWPGNGFQPAAVDLEVGGSAHYVSAQLAACGEDVLTVGAVGSDGAGQWIRQSLVGWVAGQAAVLLVETGRRTSRLVLVPGGDELAVFADVTGHGAEVLAAHAGAAAAADYAHLSCFPGSDTLRLALLQAGAPLVADFGYMPWSGDADALARWTRPRLHGVALAVFNGKASPRDVVALARAAVRGGVPACLVTFGQDGAMALTASQEVRQPAVGVTATNPAGAGDTLVAAFLHSLHHGADLADALACGQRTAARHVGSRPSVSGAGQRERSSG
jgi:sugar/nucleoside kinase (ribokinase family)